jgi:hypothetical protein
MKIFSDLVFKDRAHGGIGAHHKFDNGFEISVQAGSFNYSTPRENLKSPDDFTSFEIAVFGPNGDFVTKDFVLGLDDDVLGWQNRGQINDLMLSIQFSLISIQSKK